jgi:hypothetical protein
LQDFRKIPHGFDGVLNCLQDFRLRLAPGRISPFKDSSLRRNSEGFVFAVGPASRAGPILEENSTPLQWPVPLGSRHLHSAM